MNIPDLSTQRRLEMVLLFDAADSNPNGDPDSANLPRQDHETGQGIVSDVAIKRRVRDTVAAMKEGEAGYELYVTRGTALYRQRARGYEDAGKDPSQEDAGLAMCRRFFDVRTFGAAMGESDFPAGSHTGPIQISLARSIDPVTTNEYGITRLTVTSKREEAEHMRKHGRVHGTMGIKSVVHYGLYRAHIYLNPMHAAKTGFSDEDLKLFVQALLMMHDFTRSAARANMDTRALIVFEHESRLGNARSSQLFDAVRVERKPGVELPRRFDDYTVSIDESAIPKSVTLHRVA